MTKSGSPNERDIQSYLLRLWHSGEMLAATQQWRASLQSIKTGERHMFADLDTLLAFLIDQTTHIKKEDERN